MAPAPRDGLSSNEAEAYRALAHQLAGYMKARDDNVELDLDLAGSLEEVLLHVRAVDDPDWSKARAMFETELGPAKVPQQTIVEVWPDKSAPWLDGWRQGSQRTGEPELDSLLDRYAIEVTLINPVYPFFNLVAPRELNAFALANKIASFPGFDEPLAGWDLYAWGNAFDIGDSVSIRPGTQLLGGWTLRILIGWGDCPAGCINGRSFQFTIAPSGYTRLISAQGDPLP